MKPCVLELPAETCRTLAATLARVGDKWSMMTIVALEDEGLRFNELRRKIGISQKMLTSTLRGLERDGYVIRTVTPAKPPRVDYALTDMGREVLGPVRALAVWALNQIDRIRVPGAATTSACPGEPNPGYDQSRRGGRQSMYEL